MQGMSARRRQRPRTRDHLHALAAAFHPHGSPAWSWERRAFVWLPAWEDPVLTESEWPVLGNDGAAASEALELVQTQARRPNYRWLTVRCPECAAEVARSLGYG
jgi:hypothetical protein